MPPIVYTEQSIRDGVIKQVNVRWKLNFIELMAKPYTKADLYTLMDITVSEFNAYPPLSQLSILDFAPNKPIGYLLVVGVARHAVGGIVADLTHSEVNLNIDGVTLESQLPVYQDLEGKLTEQFDSTIESVKIRLSKRVSRGQIKSQYTSTGRGRGIHTLAHPVRNVRYR